jgi:hypothetical protein
VSGDALRIGIRAFTERTDRKPRTPNARSSGRALGWPSAVLFFDTETTVDAAQALLFGSYRYCRWSKDGVLVCVEEGLFHADDLAATRPDEYQVLRDYADSHPAEVGPGAAATLRFRSRREFVDEVFARAAGNSDVLIVGFNLPFDLTRLATSWGPARGRFRGGFSLQLWDYLDEATGEMRENKYRPRLRYKTRDNAGAFIAFAQPARAGRRNRRVQMARFLDLRTFAHAVTGVKYTLGRLCDELRVPHPKVRGVTHGRITAEYVDYNRRDVLALEELLPALRQEFDQHPIELDPDKAYSPASIAKAYYVAMGVAPP